MRVRCPKCRKRFETEPKRPRIPENRVRELRDAGLRMADIAAKLNCSTEGVSRVITRLRAADPAWTPPIHRRGRKRIDEAEVRRLRLAGWTIPKIADSMDMSTGAVSKAIRRLGLVGTVPRGPRHRDRRSTGLETCEAGRSEVVGAVGK